MSKFHKYFKNIIITIKLILCILNVISNTLKNADIKEKKRVKNAEKVDFFGEKVDFFGEKVDFFGEKSRFFSLKSALFYYILHRF